MRYLPVVAVALLAAVFACATPGPTEYHQGAPGTVAPPVRPGHGAPVVGQPGTLVRPLPRSPHKRFIPKTTQQEQEDGIWAADGARAAMDPDFDTTTAGLALVMDGAGLVGDPAAETCRQRMIANAVERRQVFDGMAAKPLNYAACLMGRALARCLKMAESAPLLRNSTFQAAAQGAHAKAVAEARKVCDKLSDKSETDAPLKAFLDGWKPFEVTP